MFLTNQPGGAKLATTINGLLEKTTSFDMLVGFFFFSGFGTVADTLRARPETTLRVLVGMEAVIIHFVHMADFQQRSFIHCTFSPS